MPDLRSLIHAVGNLADMASAVIPGAGLVSKGADIGEKIIGIIDDLKAEAPELSQQAELQARRNKLSTAVKAKAAATSDRLRGR